MDIEITPKFQVLGPVYSLLKPCAYEDGRWVVGRVHSCRGSFLSAICLVVPTKVLSVGSISPERSCVMHEAPHETELLAAQIPRTGSIPLASGDRSHWHLSHRTCSITLPRPGNIQPNPMHFKSTISTALPNAAQHRKERGTRKKIK